jgi:hypothetical protein
MGILAIHVNLWDFRRFGLAVFRTYHLIPLQPADFLTPPIIGPLGHPDLTGRIGNALTLLDRALSDDLDEEDIGFGRPDASKHSRAVEVRILRLCPSGADDELEFIGRLAADLGELTAPISSD